MNVAPQAQPESLPARNASIIRGRSSFTGVLLRLIGMELYKIRRRAMSKVLGIIAIAASVLVFLLLSLGTIFVLNSPPETFLPRNCPPPPQSGGPPPACTTPQYTQAQLAQAKQDALHSTSEPLRLPTSLHIAIQVALTPFTVLIIILLGAIVGGEYSIGTVRLLFTRGPTRTQYLLAKIGTAIVCIVLGLLGMTLTGIVTGEILNPISGIAQQFTFFNGAWLGHALLYILIAMLDWFIFAMIALFFGTLGRSTVAGIVGALTWFFVEPIVSAAFNLASAILRQDWLKFVPDYLIGNNTGALQQNQEHYLFGGNASSLSDLHALLVLAVYLVVFIGLAWWLNERRDVTN